MERLPCSTVPHSTERTISRGQSLRMMLITFAQSITPSPQAHPTVRKPCAAAYAVVSSSVTWTSGRISRSVPFRDSATGGYVSSQWVAGKSASFPAATFAVDRSYAVWVAATDAEMVGGAQPAPFAITENSFQPASFVGR